MKQGRLKLMLCDEDILKLILQGDDSLASVLQLNIPDHWTEFGEPAFRYSLNKVQLDPDSAIWLTYLPILLASNTLIGSCGFKGAPDEMGMVEIGYEVAEQYRNKGYATEIVELLLEKAFQNEEVKTVQAHTLAEQNASVHVLKKCNFVFVKELQDKEDGSIWKWVKKR